MRWLLKPAVLLAHASSTPPSRVTVRSPPRAANPPIFDQYTYAPAPLSMSRAIVPLVSRTAAWSALFWLNSMRLFDGMPCPMSARRIARSMIVCAAYVLLAVSHTSPSVVSWSPTCTYALPDRIASTVRIGSMLILVWAWIVSGSGSVSVALALAISRVPQTRSTSSISVAPALSVTVAVDTSRFPLRMSSVPPVRVSTVVTVRSFTPPACTNDPELTTRLGAVNAPGTCSVPPLSTMFTVTTSSLMITVPSRISSVPVPSTLQSSSSV